MRHAVMPWSPNFFLKKMGEDSNCWVDIGKIQQNSKSIQFFVMIPKEIPPLPKKNELSQEFQKIPHSAFCADILAAKSLEHLGPHSRAGNEVFPFIPSMLPEGVGAFFRIQVALSMPCASCVNSSTFIS